MKTRLVGLDSLRGIAALSLVVFHVQGIPALKVPQGMAIIISHFGSGVPLFYAISAFSLMLGYEARLLEVDGLSHFYIRRFFRIIPLFYTMLCFWLIVRAFYFHASTSFSDITLNTSCLFGLLPQSHEGLVWASWSIGVEWIFYIFFPILMLMASTLMGATVLF
ncbi:MAG: acyltransferase family protein, partial [Gammaproteobacteria bacterium]